MAREASPRKRDDKGRLHYLYSHDGDFTIFAPHPAFNYCFTGKFLVLTPLLY